MVEPTDRGRWAVQSPLPPGKSRTRRSSFAPSSRQGWAAVADPGCAGLEIDAVEDDAFDLAFSCCPQDYDVP